MCLAEDVVALERRLEDVVRVEVERRIDARSRAAQAAVLGSSPQLIWLVPWLPALGSLATSAQVAVDVTRAGEARRNRRARTGGAAGVGADLEDREVASALIDGVRFLVTDG